MARPRTTIIEDLDENMVMEILCRLPSCETTLTCKSVSKHWCSLISDPKFVVHFSNHKKKNTTLSASCSDIDDDEPPWTFIASMLTSHRWMLKVSNASSDRSIFASSKFSLNFLPCADYLIIEATFKDLVLCYDQRLFREDRRVYHLCNPLTKQWVTLPPYPCDNLDRVCTCLIGEEPYDYTRDYKFRVVVLRPEYQNLANETREYRSQNLKLELRDHKIYKLLVYCSEIGEWKKIKLSVALQPGLVQSRPAVEGCVVCNGVVYINHELCLAAFDPFDVNETCDTNINARVMPAVPMYASLVESAGKLIIMRTLNFEKDGDGVRLPLILWKLDPNQSPLKWNVLFQGSCTSSDLGASPDFGPKNILIEDSRMHPNNDKLIYMYLRDHLNGDHQFVLCDTQSGCIKPLKSLPPGNYLKGLVKWDTLQRLELQWWPTPIPTTLSHSMDGGPHPSDSVQQSRVPCPFCIPDRDL